MIIIGYLKSNVKPFSNALSDFHTFRIPSVLCNLSHYSVITSWSTKALWESESSIFEEGGKQGVSGRQPDTGIPLQGKLLLHGR